MQLRRKQLAYDNRTNVADGESTVHDCDADGRDDGASDVLRHAAVDDHSCRGAKSTSQMMKAGQEAYRQWKRRPSEHDWQTHLSLEDPRVALGEPLGCDIQTMRHQKSEE
jgi:hypothetical protein